MQVQQRLRCASRAGEILKALSNRYRLLILCELTKRDCSVSDLATLLGKGQPTVSQHLLRLRRMGLVRARRKGKWVIYSVATVEAVRLISCIRELAKHSDAEFNTPIPATHDGGLRAPHARVLADDRRGPSRDPSAAEDRPR